MKHIPNILTVFRLLLVPVFALVFFSDMPNARFHALGIFILAGVTDVLDGQIARRFNLVSVVGTVLDPLADKLMLLTALVCLTLAGTMPLWAFAIVLSKELFMISTGVYMYFRKEKVVIPANRFGKMATVLFFVAVFLMVVLPRNPFTMAVLVLAIASKFSALVSYALLYRKRQRAKG
ncbi:CDP-diacylglycerol--glycerol-3-phosphate 3-phosphatidyltransferase [Anaerotalea alkaliphila]|uniref:CDP-diacylglycerol--glycerol-3-phosphate 3-phosphatidyltransferase n=1 Tax=Anaerotalea alkaliphila TaxID=2662126 RepID=A0A7X5HUC9_9FIRM|nr:CDP-diacylglycerol--glycerol-3-phosphate 3-phosphatidyltransferase [Anaerotalea alkaliphila]NDL66626.1 CDP-diacylglycerol--glycerol-3-phosphate 3-phosphatidyltransferase [Anaerotalea alkaliphila]